MKKTRNIFLTTIDRTDQRLKLEYFSCENKNGTVSYTTGISTAEAGIKYMLSQNPIDEIIVLGPDEYAEDEKETEREVADVPIDGISDLDGMSEYSFLCYRLSEFMHQIDFEIIDIEELLPEENRSALKEKLNAFKRHYATECGLKELFDLLSKDDELARIFNEQVLTGLSADEQRWLKHYLYSQMDSFFKMHMLNENRNASIRYIPVQMSGAFDMESIVRIVDETFRNRDYAINLHMDIQGFNATDGNLLISSFLLLNRKIGYGCEVRSLIKSEKLVGRFSGSILNVRKSYDIQNLLSGMEIFLMYGKDQQLKDIWKEMGINDPTIDRLFTGMDMVDEGVSLCNIELISCGIDVIRSVIRRSKDETLSSYAQVMISAIEADYGKMLEGDKLSVLELIKWSLRKGLYQQSLTIIESKFPEDIIQRGIFYYAETEKDIEAALKAFNVLYWNEPARMRYSFNEIDHYFVKFYGRFVLDFRQKPDAVAKDYAQLRIDELHGKADKLIPAFSKLNDDKLLYELLLSYYLIGNLRNKVNHAQVDRSSVESAGEIKRPDSRTELDHELGKFVKLYSMACEKVKETLPPPTIDGRKMRGYARYHELQPLEESSDLINKSRYTCSFDGKDLMIDIHMMKPEADEGSDED